MLQLQQEDPHLMIILIGRTSHQNILDEVIFVYSLLYESLDPAELRVYFEILGKLVDKLFLLDVNTMSVFHRSLDHLEIILHRRYGLNRFLR